MLHECLACERTYDDSRPELIEVPEDYRGTYCSLTCYTDFEALLDADVKAANAAELNAPAATQPTESELRKIVGAFNFKVKP